MCYGAAETTLTGRAFGIDVDILMVADDICKAINKSLIYEKLIAYPVRSLLHCPLLHNIRSSMDCFCYCPVAISSMKPATETG